MSAEMPLADLQLQLAEVRVAIAKVIKNGGVIRYSIDDRSADYDLPGLRSIEREYMARVNNHPDNTARRGRFKQPIPVDVR